MLVSEETLPIREGLGLPEGLQVYSGDGAAQARAAARVERIGRLVRALNLELEGIGSTHKIELTFGLVPSLETARGEGKQNTLSIMVKRRGAGR